MNFIVFFYLVIVPKIFNFTYIPSIFFKIKHINPIVINNTKIRIIRNLGILNKFRKGVRIIKIKPIKLLIKNRGYLIMFVQKLFIF